MTLTKQNLPVPFINGIDTLNDPFLIETGSHSEIDNGAFVKNGTIKKRNGYSKLGTGLIDRSGDLPAVQAITTFNDDLVALTQDSLFTYAQENDTWIEKGSFSSLQIDTKPIVRNNKTQINFDYLETSSLGISVWEQEGSVYYSVIDSTTDSSIVNTQAVHTYVSGISGHAPKLSTIGTTVQLFYWTVSGTLDTKLNCRSITVGDPSTVSTSVVSISGSVSGDAILPYAVAPMGNKILVVAQNTTDTAMDILYVDKSGTPDVAYFPSAIQTAPGSWANQAMSLTVRGSLIAIVAKKSGDNGQLILLQNYLPTPSESVAYRAVTLSTVLGTGKVSLLDNSDTSYTIVSSNITSNPLTDATTKIHTVTHNNPDTFDKATWTITDTAGSTKSYISLASEAFEVNDITYFLASYQGATADADNVQPTIFVFDTTFNIAGKVLAGVAGNHVGNLPKVWYSGGIAQTLVGVRTRLTAQEGRLLTPQGISRVSMDFNATAISTTQLGDNLHIATGGMYDFDGQNVVEHGFHLFPEKPTSTLVSGSLISGTYLYTALYEWIDVQGQIHQSAPSVPLTVGITGAATGVQVVVYPTPATVKTGVEVALYRTKTLGTTYYKVTSAALTGVMTFTDSLADTTLEANQFLYTTGDIIENIAPPACKIVQKHNNRVFIAGLEDKNTIWYSKESVTNEAVCFSDLFQLRVNPAGGPITALASMDDKLFIFKEDSIYTLAGQGPVDTGVQNDYIQPQFLTANVGCKNQASIVSVPEGLMFQSDKGIWMVDKALTLQYIGAPIDGFNNLVVTSAVALPDINQVRFTTEGKCLVYQSFLKKWTTFSNYVAVSATSWKNGYYFVNSVGAVQKEDSTSRTDNGSFIPMKIATGWIKYNAQDRIRVYRAGILGRTNGFTLARVTKYIDYNEDTPEIKYFNATDMMDSEVWGDDTVFGSASVFASEKDNVYQFTMDMDNQRCSSIKFVIEDMPASSLDSYFELTSLVLQIGLKQGIMDSGTKGATW